MEEEKEDVIPNRKFIRSKDLLLCPNCKTHFPEIQNLTIKEKQLEIIITCDNCTDLHHGKVYNFKSFLEIFDNNNSHTNETKTKHCWICENKADKNELLFCITCEQWICKSCTKIHDEYVTYDQIEIDLNKKQYSMHCFCDREVHFRQKCCIHHNIKAIDKTILDSVNKGSIKSLIVENIDSENIVNNNNTISRSTIIENNNQIDMSIIKENVTNNNQKDNVLLSESLSMSTFNGKNNVSSNDSTKSQEILNSYEDCHNNSKKKPLQNENYKPLSKTAFNFQDYNSKKNSCNVTVYAMKHCLDCNLFFCETCAIDHQSTTTHCFNEKSYQFLKEYNKEREYKEIQENKHKFIKLITETVMNWKERNFTCNNEKTNKSSPSEDFDKYFTNLKNALELNKQLHMNYLQLLSKMMFTFKFMKQFGSYNENIIKSYFKLSDTNTLQSLEDNIKEAKEFYQTLHVYILTKFYFKTEKITCFQDHTVYHNGVSSMIYFKKRLYTGGKYILKKWKFPYIKQSNSTLLQTKENELTGRINCFCLVSESMMLAGSEKGFILLCEFGEGSGIKIASTDRRLPIFSLYLLRDVKDGSYRITSFLLSDKRGIWEISIETKGNKTTLSEIEFFKTRDEFGNNVSVIALVPAQGVGNCFLLGGLDYIYPKFRGNTLIKIQDSIKCSERNQNKLISCLTYVKNSPILAVGSYDFGIGALILSNPQQRSRYKEIATFSRGVVSIVSRKENEIIALSSAGEFKILNLSVCYEGLGFQWKEIASFQCNSIPSVCLVPLQSEYIAICGKDQIEIWYANI